MTVVFNLKADYGLSVSYEWNNKVTESFNGTDYCNGQWLHPITKINFSQAWFDQARYNEIVAFYSAVNGNQDIFLVDDPLDNSVTNRPLDNRGIITQGVVVNIGGQLQLCKQYKLGTHYINRPITRPELVQLFSSGGSPKPSFSVDIDTGIISSGAVDGDTWTGTFKIPMRFENDSLPIEIKGYDSINQITTYALPDLRLTEEKERFVNHTISLVPNYSHTFNLPTPINSSIETKTKTDIFISDSGYSSRDSLNSYRRVITFPEFFGTQKDVNYLIGLQRLCLGEYSNFNFVDNEANINSRFRIQNPISYTTLVDDNGDNLFNINSLSLLEDVNFIKSTYCYVWKIVRKDGEQRWFTNHDQVLNIQSNNVNPVASPVSTSANKTTELKTDSTELTSVFGVALTEADLISGKYNYADLQVSLYDWLNKVMISRLFTGNLGVHTIGYLSNKGKQYQFEATSLTDRLDSSRNVQTSSLCRHKFLSVGYGNCNLTPLGRNDPLYQFSSCNKTIGACQSYNNVKNFGGQPRLPGIDETVSRPED
jgi:uncharacterized protein (TIGR02217 family)